MLLQVLIVLRMKKAATASKSEMRMAANVMNSVTISLSVIVLRSSKGAAPVPMKAPMRIATLQAGSEEYHESGETDIRTRVSAITETATARSAT
jgi:hypothetical protein